MIFGSPGTATLDGSQNEGDMAIEANGNPPGTVVVAKDGSGNYTTIQAAINDLMYSEIIVKPGEYKENIRITRNLTIRSYDGPLTTKLIGTAAQKDTVEVNPGSTVLIEGLAISNGQDGIEIQENANVTLCNCVFWDNLNNGINISEDWPGAQKPTTLVYNCVIIENGASGICVGWGNGRGDNYPPLTVRNSILASNNAYGIKLTYSDPAGGTPISLDYNCYAGNKTGSYDSHIGPGKNVSEGTHTIYVGPLFVDGAGGDFRLQSGSPCRNAGSPGWGFMDPDGTRNDIGAYGGPGSASFFDNPTDGPMIRSLKVSPGSVPQGSLLIIEATGSVR
jgi:hypothetical protein